MNGKLFGYPISILIDSGGTKCFVHPKIVSKILVRVGFIIEPWTVEYGNRVECRVEECIFFSELELHIF